MVPLIQLRVSGASQNGTLENSGPIAVGRHEVASMIEHRQVTLSQKAESGKEVWV